MRDDLMQTTRLTSATRDLPARMAEREGTLQVWVRAPKRGHEFYSGCSRPKLYEWAGKN